MNHWNVHVRDANSNIHAHMHAHTQYWFYKAPFLIKCSQCCAESNFIHTPDMYTPYPGSSIIFRCLMVSQGTTEEQDLGHPHGLPVARLTHPYVCAGGTTEEGHQTGLGLSAARGGIRCL